MIKINIYVGWVKQSHLCTILRKGKTTIYSLGKLSLLDEIKKNR